MENKIYVNIFVMNVVGFGVHVKLGQSFERTVGDRVIEEDVCVGWNHVLKKGEDINDVLT